MDSYDFKPGDDVILSVGNRDDQIARVERMHGKFAVVVGARFRPDGTGTSRNRWDPAMCIRPATPEGRRTVRAQAAARSLATLPRTAWLVLPAEELEALLNRLVSRAPVKGGSDG